MRAILACGLDRLKLSEQPKLVIEHLNEAEVYLRVKLDDDLSFACDFHKLLIQLFSVHLVWYPSVWQDIIAIILQVLIALFLGSLECFLPRFYARVGEHELEKLRVA